MIKDLMYVIPKDQHSEESLKSILKSHSEIKFVSFVGVDLSGNDTDEKIPISIFLEDISTFLKGSVQTDGSSVSFPGIATLNNAQLDMIADLNVNWFVDYNHENIDEETRSEEHTSELQSRQYIVCRLLLEKKKMNSTSLSA